MGDRRFCEESGAPVIHPLPVAARGRTGNVGCCRFCDEGRLWRGLTSVIGLRAFSGRPANDASFPDGLFLCVPTGKQKGRGENRPLVC